VAQDGEQLSAVSLERLMQAIAHGANIDTSQLLEAKLIMRAPTLARADFLVERRGFEPRCSWRCVWEAAAIPGTCPGARVLL
jgi:hypothetical protein